MTEALKRAVRMVLWPNDEWRAISNEVPRPLALLTGFVVPLACIPAASWSVGLAVFGGKGVVARDSTSPSVGEIVNGGLQALMGSVASILLVAAALFVLAPLFARPRNWPRAFQVAVYSSSPVLLAGVLLILPDLVFALMVAAVHSFYLQYLGVQYVLGAKEGDAAEYVALVIVLVIMGSTLLGALSAMTGGI